MNNQRFQQTNAIEQTPENIPTFDTLGFLGLIVIVFVGIANPVSILLSLEGILLGMMLRYGSTGNIGLVVILVSIALTVPLGLALAYLYGSKINQGESSLFPSKKQIDRCEQQYNNHGKIIYYIGMLTPMRTLVAISAGAKGHSFLYFLLSSSVATISWFSLICVIAYTLGTLTGIHYYSIAIAITTTIISHIFYFFIINSQTVNNFFLANPSEKQSAIKSTEGIEHHEKQDTMLKIELPELSTIIINGDICTAKNETGGLVNNTPLLEKIYSYQLSTIISTNSSEADLYNFTELRQHYHFTLCSYGPSLPLSSIDYRKNILSYYHLDTRFVLVIDHNIEHLTAAKSAGFYKCLLFKNNETLQNQIQMIALGNEQVFFQQTQAHAKSGSQYITSSHNIQQPKQETKKDNIVSDKEKEIDKKPFHYLVDVLECLIESDESQTIETFSINTKLLKYCLTNGKSVIAITDVSMGSVFDKIKELLDPYNIIIYSHHGKPSKNSSDFFKQFFIDYPHNPSLIVYIYHNELSQSSAQDQGISRGIRYQQRETTEPILNKLIEIQGEKKD